MSRFCWHKWGKWQSFSEGFLENRYDALTGRLLDENERYVTGKFVHQRRQCQKCNKIQLRKATT